MKSGSKNMDSTFLMALGGLIQPWICPLRQYSAFFLRCVAFFHEYIVEFDIIIMYFIINLKDRVSRFLRTAWSVVLLFNFVKSFFFPFIKDFTLILVKPIIILTKDDYFWLILKATYSYFVCTALNVFQSIFLYKKRKNWFGRKESHWKVWWIP